MTVRTIVTDIAAVSATALDNREFQAASFSLCDIHGLDSDGYVFLMGEAEHDDSWHSLNVLALHRRTCELRNLIVRPTADFSGQTHQAEDLPIRRSRIRGFYEQRGRTAAYEAIAHLLVEKASDIHLDADLLESQARSLDEAAVAAQSEEARQLIKAAAAHLRAF